MEARDRERVTTWVHIVSDRMIKEQCAYMTQCQLKKTKHEKKSLFELKHCHPGTR